MLLITNKTAEGIYQNIKDLPIFDYHCHLNAEEIYNDKPSKNLTELWLKGDHYKWRLMRTSSIDERYITGEASDYEKFYAFLTALDGAVGNPLYLWSKFELSFYFGIELDPISKNAEKIWELVEKKLAEMKFSPVVAINMSNVNTVGTTEEIYCDFKYHKLIREGKRVKANVLPCFRGDRAINLTAKSFSKDINKLSEVVGIKIDDLSSLKSALQKQLDNFLSQGGVACDFAIEGLNFSVAGDGEVEEQFKLAMEGKDIQKPDIYKSYMLKFLLEESYARGFAVEIHIGAMRNNNSLMFDRLGADTGYDSISGEDYLTGLKNLLNSIKSDGKLGKTIVFNLNPADNEKVTTLLGCFASKESPMQFGAAWWFNDTKKGMQKQLVSLCETMPLGSFIGMLTDSRSFISYPRHDYFRRVLASYLGEAVESGEFSQDMDLVIKLAQNVAFYNAEKFFKVK